MKKNLLSKFFLCDIQTGLKTTLRYLSQRPITFQYPKERLKLAARFRGEPALLRDKNGQELCNACGLCATACPVKCIEIKPIGKGKERRAEFWEIYVGRCMFCGLCVEVCPKKCLELSEFYEISVYTRKELHYHKEDMYKKRSYKKYRK